MSHRMIVFVAAAVVGVIETVAILVLVVGS
jgi:hypothetical protein